MKPLQEHRLGAAVVVLAFLAGTALAALPKPSWQSGDELTAKDLTDNFQNLDTRLAALESHPAPEIAFLKDVRPPSANGGQAPQSTWVQRALNTIEKPGGYTWISLNGNQFTLTAGTYEILALVPSHWVNRAQARLRNATDGKTELVSSSGNPSEREGLDGQAAITAASFIMGRFTVAGGPKAFQIESIIQVASGDDSTLGRASAFGEQEVYTQVRIARLGD